MLNGTLLKREARANYKLLLIFMAVLTMYASMITAMFDPKLGDSLKQMADSMPGIFAAFGMLNMGDTLTTFLGNYLYGFLLIGFPLVFIVLLANRLVARYVDRGSMACLLASPNTRRKIVTTQAVALLLGVLCLAGYVLLLCITLGAVMFPGELDVGSFLLLNLGWFGLLVFLAGVCFAASCCFNDTKLSYGVGAGICIAFLLIQMIDKTGDKFSSLKYVTPLTLFDPMRLAAGELEQAWGFVFLYVAGLLLFAAGIEIFRRRDLPL